MKKVVIIFLFLVCLTGVYALSQPIYVKPKTSNGELIPNYNFTYEFNFTSNNDCSGVLLSNRSTIETGKDGIGFISLNISSLTQQPTRLCVYLNGTLNNLSYADVILNTLYVRKILGITANFTGNVTTDDWFKGKLNWSFIQNEPSFIPSSNESLLNVNSSDFWDNSDTPADLRWDGDLLPDTPSTYDIGNFIFDWEDIYLSGTIWAGGTMAISTGSITDSLGTIDFGNANLTTTGNITANWFKGNSGNLTNLWVGGTNVNTTINITDYDYFAMEDSGTLTVGYTFSIGNGDIGQYIGYFAGSSGTLTGANFSCETAGTTASITIRKNRADTTCDMTTGGTNQGGVVCNVAVNKGDFMNVYVNSNTGVAGCDVQWEVKKNLANVGGLKGEKGDTGSAGFTPWTNTSAMATLDRNMNATINGGIILGQATAFGEDEVFSVKSTATHGGAYVTYAMRVHQDGNHYEAVGMEIWSGLDDGSETFPMDFYDGDGDASGGIATIAGAPEFWEYSDENLKENIQLYEEDSLSKINQLQLKTFEFKDKDWGVQTGFIAQDVQKIYPDEVINRSGYLKLRNNFAYEDMIGAIQQLSAENNLMKQSLCKLGEVIWC